MLLNDRKDGKIKEKTQAATGWPQWKENEVLIIRSLK
jgi:hypothetical protein